MPWRCIHIRTCTHIHIHAYTHAHTHTHTRSHAHTLTHTHTHTHTHVHTDILHKSKLRKPGVHVYQPVADGMPLFEKIFSGFHQM